MADGFHVHADLVRATGEDVAAHQRGVRHVQLVHYTPNDIGDFQTGAITHQGLTPFGVEVIQACHRLGFVCDVAHATEDTVKQAVVVPNDALVHYVDRVLPKLFELAPRRLIVRENVTIEQGNLD